MMDVSHIFEVGQEECSSLKMYDLQGSIMTQILGKNLL